MEQIAIIKVVLRLIIDGDEYEWETVDTKQIKCLNVNTNKLTEIMIKENKQVAKWLNNHKR